MRDSDYRGLSIEGKWVFGNLVTQRLNNHSYIEYRKGDMHSLTMVLDDTVGQYTNIDDIKGTKIYEYDIVRDNFGMEFIVVLDEYENRFTGLGFDDYAWNERQGDKRYIRKQSVEEFQLEVIGKCFDNQGFLKVKLEAAKELRNKK